MSSHNGAHADTVDYFCNIPKIVYDPHATVEDKFKFKHYNAQEVILGRKMEDWLRFSVVYWHTFRGNGSDPFGSATICRPWDDGSNSIANAKRRLRVAFDFFTKLGVKYWSFHDRDISPEGASLKETNHYLDEITDYAFDLMKATGVKLLWNTCNLFAHPRYMNGAATNPDAHVVAYACAQVKKGLDVAKKLGAENFVFWGGREGYQSLLNTNLRSEMDTLAQFYRMVIKYKQSIGFEGQLLIEPKPKEPSKHQYDYDAMTVLGFLQHYGLQDHFKLNIEPNHTTLAGHCAEHDIAIASALGKLGSIDANTGSPDLGWDTDQFPMDIKSTTMIMKIVIQQGGLTPGGLNFDAKVRRESTDVEDMFIAHIGAMDAYAVGLKRAAQIIANGYMSKCLQSRYLSFKADIGLQIASGQCSLEECDKYIDEHGEPKAVSGKQEFYEMAFNRLLDA